jgi:peptide/nickel transport system substrate-binding protein
MSIGKAKKYTIWRYVDKVTAKDDYTVEFHMPEPATIAIRYILRFAPQPTSVYGEWAKKFDALFAQGKDADSDEVKALVKEFDNFRPAAYVGSGPYVMDAKSITEAQMTLVKNPGGLFADKVKFDKIVLYNGETAAITPLVLDKKIDFATHAFPPATEKQILAQNIRVVRYPFYNGPGIIFNYNNPLFNKKEFRQALAYAINRDEAGTVALSKSGVGVKKMSGLSDNFVKAWIPDDVAAKLNPYAYNPAKAEELLKSIGFKKGADGIWVDDKGQPVSFEFGVPSDYTDWSAAAENIVQQLNKFGFKVTLRGTPWSQYSTDVAAGKFQIGLISWGSGIPHPQFTYTASLKNYNGGGLAKPDKEKPGMNWPLKQKWSGGEIDFEEALIESGKGLDVEKQKQVIGKIALAFNELLPVIQIFERYSNSPALENVHVKGWPADNDPIMTNAGGDNFVTIYILQGKLQPAN